MFRRCVDQLRPPVIATAQAAAPPRPGRQGRRLRPRRPRPDDRDDDHSTTKTKTTRTTTMEARCEHHTVAPRGASTRRIRYDQDRRARFGSRRRGVSASPRVRVAVRAAAVRCCVPAACPTAGGRCCGSRFGANDVCLSGAHFRTVFKRGAAVRGPAHLPNLWGSLDTLDASSKRLAATPATNSVTASPNAAR
jgi:hypothetical protein